jgi:D-serine deaminase-like pyridoxal phosphate-dependent protein
MDLKTIDTPVPIVYIDKLKRNIREMAELAEGNNVLLRPMIKTHKSSEIALMQMEAGACGLTVASLGEAEIMIKAGINDIFIAYELIGIPKLERLSKLLDRGVNISLAIDSIEGARQLNSVLEKKNKKVPYLIEVDSGLKRCGLSGLEIVKLADKISKLCKMLKLKGIFTHAGQVYAAKDHRKVRKIGIHEGEIMADTAWLLRKNGFEIEIVSVGSTPTVRYSAQNPEVTEIRPGNYVFYDNIQIGLGVVNQDSCALRILSTIISRPEPARAVIDAGSKTLALDRGAHGINLVEGFGLVIKDGFINKDIIIDHLSEEHGVLKLKDPKMKLEIGDIIEIIPNHSCTVVNLFDRILKIHSGKITGFINVNGRGAVR